MEFESDFMDVNVVPEQDVARLELEISGLQDEISALRSQQRFLDSKRKEILNRILDIKGSIRVFGRVKPLIQEKNSKKHELVFSEAEKITVTSGGVKKEFCADKVFDQRSTQEDVFLEVEPILRSAMDGHNVCIFAYGQTGTGKTFTMEGTNDQPGIVPRAIEELFHQSSLDKSRSFVFSMSMLEVYLGSLRDLLAQKKCVLNILAGSNGYVEIEGLTDVSISDVKLAKRLYTRGKRARSTSWTNVNDASSRSHCLTRITITRKGYSAKGHDVLSKLWMVDLGGSERLLKTGATGQTMDEGKAINLSLSALGDVIAALKKKHGHIPFRNSKLTQLLSDSLGNGSKVLMIVHISPCKDDLGETVCSLNFAKRVRAIESNREHLHSEASLDFFAVLIRVFLRILFIFVHVPVDQQIKKQKENAIAELNQQISEAEEELQKLRNQIERTEDLLLEKKKLVEEQKGSPTSPLVIQHIEVVQSPKTTERLASKQRCSSLPHFMVSTACSRLRQCASGEVSQRMRKSRLGMVHSIDAFGSQFLSYSDSQPKLKPRYLKSKPVTGETDSTRVRDFRCLESSENNSYNSSDLKPSLATRSRRITGSYPNFRATLYQHRRRMSDLT
ncbi:putative minus-end-directed kinesin ATPase [Dioscorea sansibarensis]